MKRMLILTTGPAASSPKGSKGKGKVSTNTNTPASNSITTDNLDIRPAKKARHDSSKPCQEQNCLQKQSQDKAANPPPTSTSTPPLSPTESLIQSLKATARCLRSQKDYNEARKAMEKVIPLQPVGSRALMESLTELGSICFDAGDMDASMNHHNVALNMYLDQQCDACFAALAIVNLRHVAAIYLRFGKCREALLCYTFIYKIQQTATLDCPIEEVASTLSCIGLMNYLMEEYEEALRFYKDELRLRVQLHNGGMEHEDIAIALNSIGIVYFQLDHINEARQSFQSCLQIRQRLLGDDPATLMARNDGRSNDYCYDLAMVYFNLAAIAMKQGDDQQASRLYRRSMELKKAVFGDHPEIAVDYQYLGQLFLDHGDSQAAVEYYTEAYKVVQVLSTQEEQNQANGEEGQALSAAQKLLVIIGNIHLLEADIDGMMESFEKAARLSGSTESSFMENVRVFGCQLYSISRMHPPCAPEA